MESVLTGAAFSDCIRAQLIKEDVVATIDIDKLLDEASYIGEAESCVDFVLQNVKR
ncbi:hypothetical protein D3C75_847050 [compost metagenome]